MRHGAKVKLCSKAGCTNQSRKGGVCIRHGARKKRCSFEECTNQAQTGGLCLRHGGKRKLCCIEGCTNQSQVGECVEDIRQRLDKEESAGAGDMFFLAQDV